MSDSIKSDLILTLVSACLDRIRDEASAASAMAYHYEQSPLVFLLGNEGNLSERLERMMKAMDLLMAAVTLALSDEATKQ